MWDQAELKEVVLLPVNKFGWKFEEGIISYIWDTEENILKVRERVKEITKGCSCKTGCTSRCKCWRKKLAMWTWV
jgi:hypothetical protein